MIRINLLKQLQVEAQPSVLVESANKRKRTILIGGALALVVLAAAALLQYPTLLGGIFSSGKKEVVAEISKVDESKKIALKKPKKVTANAVEETIHDDADQNAPLATGPSYADLVPSQKVEFQSYAALQILKDIKSVTPPEVGFANFIFTPPGDFYLHGLARDEENYQKLKQGLSTLKHSEVKPGLNLSVGAKSLAREFSFYGSMSYPLSHVLTPPDHVISESKLKDELVQLKTLATTLGIKLREPKRLSSAAVGEAKRMIYQAKAECNYQQMQDLIAELHQAKSNLGFLKFALNAVGDEKVNAELDIVVYVN